MKQMITFQNMWRWCIIICMGMISVETYAQSTTQALSVSGLCSENPSATRRWRITNPNTFNVNVNWEITPNALTGSIVAAPGQTEFNTTTLLGSNNIIIRWQNGVGQQQTASAQGVGTTCGCIVEIVQGDTAACLGSTITLNAVVSGNNGAPFNLLWNTGALGSSITVPVNAAATYWVAAINGLTNCQDQITVSIYDPTPEISANGPTTFCQSSVLLSCTPALTYQWRRNGLNIAGATSQTFLASLGGTYTCVVTTPCGNGTSPGLFVNKLSVPSATITPTSMNLCAGQTGTLSTNTGTNRSYQWIKDGVPITGATSPALQVSVQGLYWVRVTNTVTGCQTNSFKVPVRIVSCAREASEPVESEENLTYFLALEEEPVIETRLQEAEIRDFYLYPNPATDRIQMVMENLAQERKAQVLLTDLAGRVVMEEQLILNTGWNNQELMLPSTLNAGVYLLQISSGDFVKFERLAIQR
jgi:hypothetical protein